MELPSKLVAGFDIARFKEICLIELNDGSIVKNIQLVLESDLPEF